MRVWLGQAGENVEKIRKVVRVPPDSAFETWLKYLEDMFDPPHT